MFVKILFVSSQVVKILTRHKKCWCDHALLIIHHTILPLGVIKWVAYGKPYMLTQTVRKIEVATWNHQADCPFYMQLMSDLVIVSEKI